MKNKKICATIVLLIIIIVVGIFLKEKVFTDDLIGKRTNDYVYLYGNKDDSSYYMSIELKGDSIYYLLYDMDESSNLSSYVAYKEGLYRSSREKLGELKSTNKSCAFENDQIKCISPEGYTLYDYYFKEILNYNLKNKEIELQDAIPYKDTYILMENNHLWMQNEKGESSIHVLSEELANETAHYYDEYTYYHNDDNTYIVFNDMHEKSYVYDVNKDEYSIIEKSYAGKYEDGLYFFDEESILIHNLKENKIDEYALQGEIYYNSVLTADKKFYTYTNSKLSIIDLVKGSINTIEVDVTDEIFTMSHNEQYFTLNTRLHGNNIYLVDLANIPKSETK